MHASRALVVNILLVHRWFWPDSPPYAEMLRVIAARLARDGHRVRVLTAQPSYTSSTAGRRCPRRETLDGFEVRRCRLLPESRGNVPARVLNLLLFAWAILRQGWARPRWDAVMTSTMPPVLVGWAGRGCARLSGARFVYHMMDVHPEAAAIGGVMRRGPLYRWLRWLDARTCARAERVVVLSGDMKRTLAARGVPTGHVEQIDNFELRGEESTDHAGPAANADGAQEPAAPRRFTVLFAGNVGRFQALDGLMDAAARLRERDDLRFLFLGEGAGLPRLRQRAARLPEGMVELRGQVPVADARRAMRAADLGIVALQPGIHRVAFPSKTMTYGCQGLPMLALVEEDSSLARLVRDHDLGAVADPLDGAAIAGALESFLQEPEAARRERRRRIRAFAAERWTPEAAAETWSRFFAAWEPAAGGDAQAAAGSR